MVLKRLVVHINSQNVNRIQEYKKRLQVLQPFLFLEIGQKYLIFAMKYSIMQTLIINYFLTIKTLSYGVNKKSSNR